MILSLTIRPDTKSSSQHADAQPQNRHSMIQHAAPDQSGRLWSSATSLLAVSAEYGPASDDSSPVAVKSLSLAMLATLAFVARGG